eukprot:1611572-Prymnesium_polylepis.1
MGGRAAVSQLRMQQTGPILARTAVRLSAPLGASRSGLTARNRIAHGVDDGAAPYAQPAAGEEVGPRYGHEGGRDQRRAERARRERADELLRALGELQIGERAREARWRDGNTKCFRHAPKAQRTERGAQHAGMASRGRGRCTRPDGAL